MKKLFIALTLCAFVGGTSFAQTDADVEAAKTEMNDKVDEKKACSKECAKACCSKDAKKSCTKAEKAQCAKDKAAGKACCSKGKSMTNAKGGSNAKAACCSKSKASSCTKAKASDTKADVKKKTEDMKAKATAPKVQAVKAVEKK